jgi:hypothetical protein
MTGNKAAICCVLYAVGAIFFARPVCAQSNSNQANPVDQPQNSIAPVQTTVAEPNSGGNDHGGQHDFDFEVGTWKIHLKRLLHPLAGSTAWVEFDGSCGTREVWGDRAQLEEFETDSPAAGHIEGLTLRLYNPRTHQWRLFWANN